MNFELLNLKLTLLLSCGVRSVLSCRRHACCVAGKTGDIADLKLNTSRAFVEATDIADLKANTSRAIVEATDIADVKANTSRAIVEATDIADLKLNISRAIVEATDNPNTEVEGERDVRTR